MITGLVTADLEAVIPVGIHDVRGHVHHVDAVIDTGFNAFIALSKSLIAKLGLKRIGGITAQLADGTVKSLDVFAAVIEWGGKKRTIEAYSIDAGVLLGMDLLAGSSLHIDVVDGGSVTIQGFP